MNKRSTTPSTGPRVTARLSRASYRFLPNDPYRNDYRNSGSVSLTFISQVSFSRNLCYYYCSYSVQHGRPTRF